MGFWESSALQNCIALVREHVINRHNPSLPRDKVAEIVHLCQKLYGLIGELYKPNTKEE